MLSRRLLRIKAIKALYAHFKSGSDSPAASEKNLMFSVGKTYELYHQLLWLIVDIANTTEERIEAGRRKYLPTPKEKNPNRKFIENQVVGLIRDSTALVDYLQQYGLGWANYPETIKKLHSEMVESTYYTTYMDSEERSFAEDRRFVEHFYKNTVGVSEALEETLEEQSIMWADDLDFANILVLRTLGDMKPGQPDLPLLPKFKNEDDEKFVRMLFRGTVANRSEYFNYIDRFTSNWDVERIAFMDNLIMAAAMTELIDFHSIPVKVTLDEYIEIAKYYSTASSSTFINGVLDKIVEALREEGRIEKSGRGLLEK